MTDYNDNPETKTREDAINIAATLATPDKNTSVYRIWHPQAKAEPIASVSNE